MKLQKLVLENFSSYCGKHEFEFHTTPDKPVTIVVGGGGKGKTSVFDAINWALYGQQYEAVLKQEGQKSMIDYANESAVSDAASANESVEVACTLIFEHGGKHYKVQQAIVVAVEHGKLEIKDRTASLFEVTPTGNSDPILNIGTFLDEILPSNVRDYFLFNGDRINQLALPGASQEIRDGIYRVVDLELLQNGANPLMEVAKKYRRLARESSVGEAAILENTYSEAYEALEKLRSDLANATKEVSALEDKVEIVQDRLRSMEGVRALQSRRDVLQEGYDIRKQSLRGLINELRSVAATASLALGLEDIRALMRVLDGLRQKGEIPSSVSESLLKDLLEIGKCICGTEFKKGDSVYQELERRLTNEREKGKKGQDLLDAYFSLSAASTEIGRALRAMPELETKRVSLDQSMIEIDRELRDIMVKLKDTPSEEISGLANNLKEYMEDLSDVKSDIRTFETKIIAKEDEIGGLQARREELSAKQERVRHYQLREDLAQRAANELQGIFVDFSESSRKEVEARTRDEFRDFIPTAHALKIGIDSDFHYDVRDQNGNAALQQLSMGQKQALSLAYITSISRVSEKNPPLVIDMPFGRLDEEVQENVARRLPELAAQVILLMLPGPEWNPRIRAILEPKASDIYNLEFDERSRQTSISKVH